MTEGIVELSEWEKIDLKIGKVILISNL